MERIQSSIPQQNAGGQSKGPQALFHSVRDIALILDKTFQSGYGPLRAGTIMAKNSETGKLVPYPEELATVNAVGGKTYLVADGTNTSAIVYCTIEQSYRFAIGDKLVIDCDQAVNSQDLGAITAIDRTDANGTRAKITATTALSDAGGDFTVANSVCIYVKGGDTSHPFTKAEFILDQDIDTGVGANAQGGLGSVVLSNAILYLGVLKALNYDSAALTDLGASVDGLRYLILK